MTKGRLVIRSSQRPPVSFRIDLRVVTVLLALGLVTLAGMFLNIGYGEYPVAPLDMARTVVGMDVGDGSYHFIVNTLRLPRVLVAFMVGAGMAISGAILQGLTHNALAAPEIIGVSAGAGLATVTLIVALPSVSTATLPPAAFVGALAVAVFLYALAWKGHSSPIRLLILIGIGLAAVASALTTVMIVFGDIFQVSKALIWLTGSVYGRSWEHVWTLLPWLAIFVPVSLLYSRHLNALGLGDEVAKGLGARVEVECGVLLLTSVALSASAVATAGMVGFVGLMAPAHSPAARWPLPRRFGPDGSDDGGDARGPGEPPGAGNLRPHRDTLWHHHRRRGRPVLPLPAL